VKISTVAKVLKSLVQDVTANQQRQFKVAHHVLVDGGITP